MLYLELPHLSRKIHNRFNSNHIQLDRLQRTFSHTIVRLDPRDKFSNKPTIEERISSTSVIFSSNLMVAALWKTTPTSETNVLNIFWVEEVQKSAKLWLLHRQTSIVRKPYCMYISCSPQIFFLQWLWKTGLERDLRLDFWNGGFKKRKTNFLSYCPYPIVLYSILTKTLTN